MNSLSQRLSRRRFLRDAALGAGLCAAHQFAPRLLGVERSIGDNNFSPRALVLIQLEGGNDGCNTVVPFHDDNYYRLRPTLALSRRDLVFLNDRFAVNASCSAWEPLFHEGKLAVVEDVGPLRPSLSHFRATEIWQTACAGEDVVYSGWAGRCFAPTRPVSGFYSTTLLPRLFARADDRTSRGSQSNFRTKLSTSGTDPAACLGEVSERIGRGPTSEIYFISMPGFDTHFRQAEVHAGRLRAIASALATFQRRLEQRRVDRRVTTLVFSEFSRSAAENSQGGTDHGGSGPVFLLGGAVRGGHYNEHFIRENSSATETRPFDFRRIVNTATSRWLGVPSRSVFEEDPGNADFLLS